MEIKERAGEERIFTQSYFPRHFQKQYIDIYMY